MRESHYVAPLKLLQLASLQAQLTALSPYTVTYGYPTLAEFFNVCFQIETTDRYTHTYCASLAVFIDDGSQPIIQLWGT